MPKQIFIYVGPHRSGSIFLQRTIFPHIAGLCSMFTHDPECNNLVWDAMDQHPMFVDTDAIRERIHRRFEGVKEDRILLSNEEFFGDYGKYNSDGFYISKPFDDHQHRTELLARLFDGAKIILTPRRQDLWLESAYMHFVHNFHTLTIDEFLNPDGTSDTFKFSARSRRPCCDTTALDWSVYVENYYRVFGRENVLVVPHEFVLNEVHAFLDRLADFFGLPAYHPETIAHINRSYSKRALRIALALNRFVWTERNPCGIIPTFPFNARIQERREVRDSKLLWLLAGVTRRISLSWFLSEVVDRFGYRKPDILGPERRQRILEHYKDKNRRYQDLIGFDLERFGYY
jgi:hypothetical protein